METTALARYSPAIVWLVVGLRVWVGDAFFESSSASVVLVVTDLYDTTNIYVS